MKVIAPFKFENKNRALKTSDKQRQMKERRKNEREKRLLFTNMRDTQYNNIKNKKKADHIIKALCGGCRLRFWQHDIEAMGSGRYVWIKEKIVMKRSKRKKNLRCWKPQKDERKIILKKKKEFWLFRCYFDRCCAVSCGWKHVFHGVRFLSPTSYIRFFKVKTKILLLRF